MRDALESKREGAPRARPVESVEAVFDEHAELRDVLAQLEETADLGILRGVLQRLDTLLEKHFAREEAPEGVLRTLGRVSPRHANQATELIAEHPGILSTVRELVERTEADSSRPAAPMKDEIAALRTRLQRHDARETDLLSDTVGVDSSALRRSAETPSRALEVNLRRTAVDVLIPAEQSVLLDIISDLHGVCESTRKLLREVNHPYIGWSETLEDLHRHAMGDFAYYLARKRAPEAIGVFCSLYAKASEEASPPALRENAVRKHLYYLEKVVRESGGELPHLLPRLEQALARLSEVFRHDPHLAVIASSRLRRFVEALVAVPSEVGGGTTQRSLALLSSVLRRVYEHWLAREDPADWWRDLAGAGPAAPSPGLVAAISHAGLRANMETLDRLSDGEGSLAAGAAALLALPGGAQIERGYLDAVACVDSDGNECWQNQLVRVRWLIKVLAEEALTSVHELALVEISHSCANVSGGADSTRLGPFVREIFASLRRSHLSSSQSAFNLIAKIGLEALSAKDPDSAQLVIDEILDWEFPTPDFSGFTDEWQVRVNPAHLRAIRSYLSVIEADPKLARRLIAALVVHLKIGGVFIADTDLFQKDVSKLLNSKIEAVYHQLKHLLKIFPVYFSDIGSEGELREISSRIDDIGSRKDPLCYFLRKQCHVESNPRLGGFIQAIGHFWATGERASLLPYVPASLYDPLDIEDEQYSGVHQVFSRLADSQDVSAIFELEPSEIEHRLEKIPAPRDLDREKVALLFRLHKLIGRKYELDHEDLLERLGAFHGVAPEEVEKLRRALADERDEAALELLLDILERLKEIIVSPERTEGVEDIYRKRHIAAGIPSIYGRYREEKFEAMGLTFRIESLANVLFERMIAEHNLEYITRNTLQKVADWLRLMLRALRVDGCQGRGLTMGIAMLEQALAAEGISVDQYVNIFQLISHSVENLIRIRFLDPYEAVVERLVQRMVERGVIQAEPGSDAQETVLKISETFLRDLIAESFGLQQLDNFVGAVLRTLVREREKMDRETLTLLMTYDTDRCCVAIDQRDSPLDGAVYLGNKGHLIKQLAHYGLPVPDGFILTTEVFRCHTAILACDELRYEVEEKIRRQVARLERLSGSRFGDSRRPLLLSVRSGAAISMPGVLDTFLNVGMSEAIAEGLAARLGSPWGAWDAYRRFIQFWGMGHGLDRDLFDALMREAKQKSGVARKSHFPPERMKEVALRYRDFLLDHGVEIAEDPFEQLLVCVGLVLRSWNAEKARAYRSAMQIAEEWGTAVIVQSMVYGNLHERSGTGVLLTCDPRQTSEEVRLYGDFVVQGQGDDVVGGLVETFPITEKQRLSESKAESVSLERNFPRIYEALARHARTLIYEIGMFHQEIEFTFESDEPADLYILQTRDTVLSQASSVLAFVPGETLESSKLATGIGAGGGALSGRVAHTAADIATLRERFPDDPIILLRPDTVPDDIPLVLKADGMLTALGGATSHAAVVAQRLGRTCVVGCRQLEVHDEEGRSILAGRAIKTGDFLSVSGNNGSVYLGRHSSTLVRRRRLA